MSFIRSTLPSVLLLSTGLAFATLAPQAHAASATEQAQIETWLGTLAADEAAGRQAGTPSSQRIGDWLAGEMKALGLQPLPGRDSYFQSFSFKLKNGKEVHGRNLLAVLPGSQAADNAEYVLLSAHYDHVGVDPKHGKDSIFNGADDNASGVTAVLGTLAQLQQQIASGQRPQRHILVAFWDAEEMGMRGARHYVQQPIIALEKIVTNLNFEMVGVTTDGGQKNNLWMTGPQFSTLFDELKPVFANQGWTLDNEPFPQWNLFRQSDNIAFAEARNVGSAEQPQWAGIPAHSLSVWRGQKYYHQPSDEVKNMDYANLHALTRTLAHVVQHVAQPSVRISWKADAPVKYVALQGCEADVARTC